MKQAQDKQASDGVDNFGLEGRESIDTEAMQVSRTISKFSQSNPLVSMLSLGTTDLHPNGRLDGSRESDAGTTLQGDRGHLRGSTRLSVTAKSAAVSLASASIVVKDGSALHAIEEL